MHLSCQFCAPLLLEPSPLCLESPETQVNRSLYSGGLAPQQQRCTGLAHTQQEAFTLVKKAGAISPTTLQMGPTSFSPSGPQLQLAFTFLQDVTTESSALPMPCRCAGGAEVYSCSHHISTWLQWRLAFGEPHGILGSVSGPEGQRPHLRVSLLVIPGSTLQPQYHWQSSHFGSWSKPQRCPAWCCGNYWAPTQQLLPLPLDLIFNMQLPSLFQGRTQA